MPIARFAFAAIVKLSLLPSKYPDPPTTSGVHCSAGAKGAKAWTDGTLTVVRVNALVLLSTNRLLWQVSNWVLLTAVKGEVGGVKLAPVVKPE